MSPEPTRLVSHAQAPSRCNPTSARSPGASSVHALLSARCVIRDRRAKDLLPVGAYENEAIDALLVALHDVTGDLIEPLMCHDNSAYRRNRHLGRHRRHVNLDIGMSMGSTIGTEIDTHPARADSTLAASLAEELQETPVSAADIQDTQVLGVAESAIGLHDQGCQAIREQRTGRRREVVVWDLIAPELPGRTGPCP
jgi:hypothetical protein